MARAVNHKPRVRQMESHSVRPPSTQLLLEVFHRLLRHFGPQHWWPANSALEMMVGAILAQNTAWSNVQKAIKGLSEPRVLSFEALFDISEEDLGQFIRPCGYYHVKAHRIKNLIAAVSKESRGSLDAFLSLPTEELRHKLLSISGVGPETADSIILYAAQRPVFVADLYTRRALSRHGWIASKSTYDETRYLFMQRLEPDVQFFNEYHALWVALGKTYCRSRARCHGCPLEDLLDL